MRKTLRKSAPALAVLAAGFGLVAASPAFAAGDAKAGAQLFQQCAICHSNKKGVNMIGPSLFGVVGRKAGTEPGYSYDAAMKKFGKTWTEARLDKYITDPQKYIPGVKMIYPGMPSATDRANLIAYLATLK